MGELKVGQAVIKCSKPTIEKMKRFYGPYIQAKQPEASVFFVKLPSCAITAYRSGKVLFQGKSAEQEAEQWQQTAEKNEAVVQKKVVKKHAKASIYDPPSNIGSLSLIGSDEVGTGDYFGPITVAAVFVAKEQLRELGELGLKDSKLLNDRQIYDLAESVKPVVVHCLLTLRNPKYNELRDQGMTQGKMKAMLHNQALNHVLRKLDGKPYDGILIDQFAEPSLYYKYLRGTVNAVRDRVWFQTKAESVHPAVAAASIIARQAFLDEMEKIGEEVGMEIPKGAGPIVDQAASRFIREKGVDALRGVAKLHFANTKRAVELAK